MAFISRHYKYGPLSRHIFRVPTPFTLTDEEYTPTFMLNVAYDVSMGIREMHERGLVHNDIKPANVLLERDTRLQRYACVLCDYGIAQVVGQPIQGLRSLGESTARGASAAYAAPEVFQKLRSRPPQPPSPQVVAAGDVYAFGVLLYEMLVRRLPWVNEANGEEMGAGDIEKRVMSGERPPMPEWLVQGRSSDSIIGFLCSLMEMCWTADPLQRPDMKSVTKHVQSFRQKLAAAQQQQQQQQQS